MLDFFFLDAVLDFAFVAVLDLAMQRICIARAMVRNPSILLFFGARYKFRATGSGCGRKTDERECVVIDVVRSRLFPGRSFRIPAEDSVTYTSETRQNTQASLCVSQPLASMPGLNPTHFHHPVSSVHHGRNPIPRLPRRPSGGSSC